MNESKARKKKRRKKKKGSFKSEFHRAKHDNARQKRVPPPRNDGRSKTVASRNLFTIQRNGFSRLLFFFLLLRNYLAVANRGNRPRDRRFPRKLNISSVTWPHNFSLPHDARLSPRIIPRDTFDPVTFPSRYSRHEGSFFHSRTPNVPPPLSYPIVDHSWNATRSFPPCDYQLVIVQRSFTLTSERSLIRRL